MVKVGKVKEIWRYPVKGMAGEKLQKCQLGKNGFKGDRLWAVRDIVRQEIQSCKFRPNLLKCIAKFRDEESAEIGQPVDIIFPDDKIIGSNTPNIDQILSELIGYKSTLEALPSIDDIDFFRRYKPDDITWLEELKATFERQQGEALPDLDNLPQSAQDFVSLPGTFFLVTPFHLVTTATMEHMKKLNPDSDWNIERFRPNLVIETESNLQGLVEQEWLGSNVVIGESLLSCNATTPRCGAVTKEQQNLTFDPQILRTMVKETDQNLGVYGEALQAGNINVGDDIYLT